MSDFIPEHLVMDILSRLPTKSLIRFRCVSKLWNSLISSPNFINSHLNHSLSNPKNSYDNLPLVIARLSFREPYSLRQRLFSHHFKLFIDTEEVGSTFDEYLEIPSPLELENNPRHSRHLSCYVEGLFCFCMPDDYVLWNPSIRKSVILPKPGITKKLDDSLEDYSGFGFDSRTNDYKVVRVVNLLGTGEMVKVTLVEVYSLNAGLWKVSSEAGNTFPPRFGIHCSSSDPACLEGAIHWAGVVGQNREIKNFVLAFDLSDEVFNTISLPNELANAIHNIRISIHRGSLSLLCDTYFSSYNKSCTIWIMKEYGVVDSWYKYVKVDRTGGTTCVRGIRNDGHILLETLRKQEFSSYDPRNKQIKRLEIHGSISNFHVYRENLILLNKTDASIS